MGLDNLSIGLSLKKADSSSFCTHYLLLSFYLGVNISEISCIYLVMTAAIVNVQALFRRSLVVLGFHDCRFHQSGFPVGACSVVEARVVKVQKIKDALRLRN